MVTAASYYDCSHDTPWAVNGVGRYSRRLNGSRLTVYRRYEDEYVILVNGRRHPVQYRVLSVAQWRAQSLAYSEEVINGG